jgi:hypothetical protein
VTEMQAFGAVCASMCDATEMGVFGAGFEPAVLERLRYVILAEPRVHLSVMSQTQDTYTHTHTHTTHTQMHDVSDRHDIYVFRKRSRETRK